MHCTHSLCNSITMLTAVLLAERYAIRYKTRQTHPKQHQAAAAVAGASAGWLSLLQTPTTPTTTTHLPSVRLNVDMLGVANFPDSNSDGRRKFRMQKRAYASVSTTMDR